MPLLAGGTASIAAILRVVWKPGSVGQQVVALYDRTTGTVLVSQGNNGNPNAREDNLDDSNHPGFTAKINAILLDTAGGEQLGPARGHFLQPYSSGDGAIGPTILRMDLDVIFDTPHLGKNIPNTWTLYGEDFRAGMWPTLQTDGALAMPLPVATGQSFLGDVWQADCMVLRGSYGLTSFRIVDMYGAVEAFSTNFNVALWNETDQRFITAKGWLPYQDTTTPFTIFAPGPYSQPCTSWLGFTCTCGQGAVAPSAAAFLPYGNVFRGLMTPDLNSVIAEHKDVYLCMKGGGDGSNSARLIVWWLRGVWLTQ